MAVPNPGAERASEPAPDRVAPPSIIPWSRTARRLRAVLLVIGTTAVTLWLVLGFLGEGPSVRLLAELLGIGILLVFAVEVVVVGGAAVRGMFAAGSRGDRLAGQDVYLLPPQLLRTRRRAQDGTSPSDSPR